MKTTITILLAFCAITVFAQNPPDFIIENGNRYDRIKTQADLAKIKSMEIEKIVKKVSVDVNAPGSIVIEGAVVHIVMKGKKIKSDHESCGGVGFSCKASAEFSISITPPAGPGNISPGPPEFRKAVLKEFGNEVPQDGKFMFFSKTADELIIREF